MNTTTKAITTNYTGPEWDDIMPKHRVIDGGLYLSIKAGSVFHDVVRVDSPTNSMLGMHTTNWDNGEHVTRGQVEEVEEQWSIHGRSVVAS